MSDSRWCGDRGFVGRHTGDLRAHTPAWADGVSGGDGLPPRHDRLQSHLHPGLGPGDLAGAWMRRSLTVAAFLILVAGCGSDEGDAVFIRTSFDGAIWSAVPEDAQLSFT